jgi:hypothetical protein
MARSITSGTIKNVYVYVDGYFVYKFFTITEAAKFFGTTPKNILKAVKDKKGLYKKNSIQIMNKPILNATDSTITIKQLREL